MFEIKAKSKRGVGEMKDKIKQEVQIPEEEREEYDEYECGECGHVIFDNKNISGKRFCYCLCCDSCRTHYSINRKWKAKKN